MTRSSSMTSCPVLRCLAPRLPVLSVGSVFGSMPLGRIVGRPVTPLSLAISARKSATTCFSAAFSASRRSVRASRSPRDSSERGIFSGTDMPGTNRVRYEQVQPRSSSYLPGFLPQVLTSVHGGSADKFAERKTLRRHRGNPDRGRRRWGGEQSRPRSSKRPRRKAACGTPKVQRSKNCTSRLSERAEAGRKPHLSRLYTRRTGEPSTGGCGRRRVTRSGATWAPFNGRDSPLCKERIRLTMETDLERIAAKVL